VNVNAVGQLALDSSLFGAKATVATTVNGGPKTAGPAVNEVQRLTLAATAGTFTLQFKGQTTVPLPFNATAEEVRDTLEALGAIGTGNVSVTKAPSDPVYTITFQGALGLTDQPQMHADSAGLTGGTPLNQFRITGLGMGGNGANFARSIGTGLDARPEPGGITFQQMEDLEIDLGSGNDHFTVVNTPAGTKTNIDAGAGNDLVDVKSISDHTFVNLGAGADTINVSNDAHTLAGLTGLLTVSGDVPQATVVALAKGSPAQGSLIAPVNAIQQITVDATGGTFTLSLTDPATQVTATTGNLAWNISAADLRTALGGLSTIGGVNNVQVTKAGNVYKVTFVNGMGARDVPLLASNEAGLTNGLGASDVMNVDDSGNTQPSVGVLSSSSLTGLDTNQVNEIQTLVVDATQGTFKVSFAGAQSGPLAYNVSADDLRAALENLPGTPIKPGDVAVSRNGTVYVIRFQGNLTNTDVPQIVATNVDLQKRVEPSAGDPSAAATAATALAGDPTLVPGTATVTTRVQGTANPKLNDAQVLTVNATGGTFTLSLLSGTPEQLTTRPLPFDASAEVIRQAIQDAAAAAVAPGDTFEPQKFAVTVDKYGSVYVIAFQGRLRQVDGGPGVDLLKVNVAGLVGTASVTTRMDGINYYGIEQVTIDTGSNNDVFNVQGTTPGSQGFAQGGTLGGVSYAPGVAQTNVRMHNGDEQAFVSSNADLDFQSVRGFDFLTGNLDDVRGALNLDFGTGTHGLMISDEASTVGDPNVRIVDDLSAAAALAAGLDPAAEISITGLAPAGISYKADTTSTGGVPNGNFFTGIRYWTGSGNDGIYIDGTANRSGSGQRTMTLLNTGLGNDTVTVNLNGALNQPTGDTGPDGFFALNTMGGSFSPIPTGLPARVTDNDTVDASVSTLPLVIFGGLGSDNITAGSNSDIVFGDDGRVQYADPTNQNTVMAAIGFGGRGDVISSRVLQPTWAMSRDLTFGAADTVQGLAGEDVLVGGAANDMIDGGANDDLIFGDAVKIARRPSDVTNPRFETLSGSQIYSTAAATNGADQVDGTARNYRDPNGTYVPSIANWRIHNLYHSADIQAGVSGSLGAAAVAGGTNVANSFGNDYIAGGAASDVIFGQLGNDTIQGDGSIAGALAGTPVAYAVDPVTGAMTLPPSFEAATDGADYIEGNGGNDLILGGLGQDDVIGGSSDLFTLTTPAMRPDGSDVVFGGAGTRIARNDPGDTTAGGHAADADYVLGDNGDIFRLVGTNHTDAGGFLTFNYDTYGPAKIVPRAIRTLDYTPGTGAATDIGGPDTVHGEGGDDFIHGEVGNDVISGEGQDDQIIAGAGNDRVYAGSGEDAVLGDDGRFAISRNGLTEPLYGVTAVNPEVNLSLPGPFTGTWENITGRLFAQPTLMVPTTGGDDVIYGGLGDDFLHAGAGDDAVSGGEAQAAWYNDLPVGAAFYAHGLFAVADPVNPLGYDPTTRKLAAYDANNPLALIPNYFLNFDATDGSGAKIDDGKDRLFGDDGNDWLVGGTDNNRLFGGKGDDLMNADNNLTTNGGLNNVPDPTQFADRDFVYGGDGLDVMIANTGGDRMYDWGGEFNTYLVPFAPFGDPTVVRAPSPHIQQFLLDLGHWSGADQAMTEPDGELGLFTHSDPQWQANHGGPRDPQAGNIGGGHRDTQGSPEDDRGTALPLANTPAGPAPASSTVAGNSTNALLSQVFVSPDPSNPAQNVLFVGGTNGDDVIVVKPGTTSAYLDVVVNGVDRGQFPVTSNGVSIGRIIVYGNDGNDTLTGGGGNTFMDGGDGNDSLNGGGGRDVQIGGLGQDVLNGGKGDDVLIGGTFKYSGDIDSVLGLMAIWNSSDTYDTRVANLRAGGSDGLFAFNTTTILDDGVKDTMNGAQGFDWFWAFGADFTDQHGGEANG
jgi:Ca2+-binding RTX toxin-like protein